MDEAARWGLKLQLIEPEVIHSVYVGMDEAARWGLKLPVVHAIWLSTTTLEWMRRPVGV